MKQGAEQRNATGEEGGEDRSGGEEIAHDSHRPGIGRFAETVMQPVKPTSVSAVDGPDNQRITGSCDSSVGHFRPGRTGRWPPRLSRARAMRASGDLKPNAILVIRRTFVLVDSIRPFDKLCSIAARILALCLTMLLDSFTNEGIRQRRAQLIHRSRASTAASWGIVKTTRRPSLSR